LSSEFGESQTYPCSVDGSVGVFSLVTTPRDRIAKELMITHEPAVVQPEVEESPVVELEELNEEVSSSI
jgi:hypothetical protein